MKNTEDITNRRWGNRALLFGIISILLDFFSLPALGVPFGIPFGIYAIAFAIISAEGKIRARAVAGIVTGAFGIIIGLTIYAMVFFVVTEFKDPQMLSRFKPEQIKILQDYVQLYMTR